MFINQRFLKFFSIALFVLALVISLNCLVRRYQFEVKDHYMDVAMTYKDLHHLSVSGGLAMPDMLSRVKEKGLCSVVLQEMTIQDYVNDGRAVVFKGSELINMSNTGRSNRYILNYLHSKTRVKPDCFYLVIEKKVDFNRIRDFSILAFGREQVKQISRYNIVEIFAPEEDLYELGFGLSEQQISRVQGAGLHIISQLKNSYRLDRSLIRQKFLSFVDLVPNTLVFFEGDSILGFPGYLELIKNKFQDYNLMLGMTEFSSQKGLKQLAAYFPERTILIHDVPDKELEKQSRSKYVLRYLRAAKERRVNVLLFHPLFHLYSEDSHLDVNLSMLGQLSDELRSFNFELKAVTPLQFQDYKSASALEIFALSVCLFFIFMLLLNVLKLIQIQSLILGFVLFLLLFYLAFVFDFFIYWKLAMAFFTACFFPLLGVIFFFPKEQDASQRYPFFVAIKFVVATLGLSLGAAFMVVTFLSDEIFIMGIRRFMGVKTSFIIPVVLTGLYFYLRPERLKAFYYVFSRVFYAPLRSMSLIVVSLFLCIMMILVLRSDSHFTFIVPELEQHFRAFLETTFFARPRFKEFLIGYPFLMLSAYFVDRQVSRNGIWFFVVLGAIAPISVINSFCHVHTPLAISIYRSFLGLLLGIAVGAVLICFVKLFFRRSMSK